MLACGEPGDGIPVTSGHHTRLCRERDGKGKGFAWKMKSPERYFLGASGWRLQLHLGGGQSFTKKDAGVLPKSFSVIRCKELALAIGGEPASHFGVALQVVCEAFCDNIPLGKHLYSGWRILADFADQEGVVGAGQQDGINFTPLSQQLLDMLVYEIVGSGLMVLVVFHERYPHGTGFLEDFQVGEKLADFDKVRFRLNGSPGGHDANLACFGVMADHFGSGPDHAQYPARRIQHGQVMLLDSAQGFG